MEELIELHGMKVNVWHEGIGTPLFLFLGWDGTFDQYKDLLFALSKRNFEVLSLEMPGCGKSAPPPQNWNFLDFMLLAKELLDYYGIKQSAVMGHSLGCVAAISFTKQFPDRVENLIVVNPPILHGGRLSWFRLMRLPIKLFDAGFWLFTLLLKPSSWAVNIFKFFVRIFFIYKLWKVLGMPNLKFAIHWLERQHSLLTQNSGVMRRIFRVFVEVDTLKDARDIRAPALIVGSEHGGITPLSNAKTLASNIACSTFVELKGAPHHFPGLWAEKVAEIIKNWAQTAAH